MITKPTAPPRASRHPYSTRGLSLRLLLLGAILTSLTIAVAGGQPVGAASDGREPASGAARLADGEPVGAPAGPEPAGGAVAGQSGDGGIVPAASASPPSPNGGTAGGPADDWHLYNHWTDPSWPDPGQATGERPEGAAPRPARTAGVFGWEPPVTPPSESPPSTGWTPTPVDPTDPAPGTPTGPPTATRPATDPAAPHEELDSPQMPSTPRGGADIPPGAPGEGQPDGPRTGALPTPDTTDPLPRDPVAAGPDDEDLGLGDTVEEPTPTPEPSATGGPAAAPAADAAAASGYHDTLIYSGMIGLLLAAIGLMMVGLRRRRW